MPADSLDPQLDLAREQVLLISGRNLVTVLTKAINTQKIEIDQDLLEALQTFRQYLKD